METPMIKLKDYRLRDSGTARGQIVQIPVNVIRDWNLGPNGIVEMFLTIDKELVIRPATSKKYIYTNGTPLQEE